MATTRRDIQAGTDREEFVAGVGHMRGYPSRPGESSAASTGVPTNAIAGFAPGALFINWKGSIGSLLYINSGTNASAIWTNVA